MCMTHVALPAQIMQEMSTSISARVRLGFYVSGSPFIQVLSNGLVNMNLFVCHKLERTDKATVSLILSFVVSIPSSSSLLPRLVSVTVFSVCFVLSS